MYTFFSIVTLIFIVLFIAQQKLRHLFPFLKVNQKTQSYFDLIWKILTEIILFIGVFIKIILIPALKFFLSFLPPFKKLSLNQDIKENAQVTFDPPTEKQLRYAAKIGIDVPSTMSKGELSRIIAWTETRNPDLAFRRKQINTKAHERKFGKELVDEENQWCRFGDEIGYMLAIYSWRNATIVDVLLVHEAVINTQGKLILGVSAPKVVKDRYIGDWLDWDKYFELPNKDLLYYEALHLDFHSEGNSAYKKIVEKGLKIARKL